MADSMRDQGGGGLKSHHLKLEFATNARINTNILVAIRVSVAL